MYYRNILPKYVFFKGFDSLGARGQALIVLEAIRIKCDNFEG
jgi:hypothetical protein